MATEDPALRARGANFRLFLPRKQSLRGHPALFDGEYPIPNGSSPQIHVDAAHILQGTAGFVHSNALLHRVSWFSTRLFRIRLDHNVNQTSGGLLISAYDVEMAATPLPRFAFYAYFTSRGRKSDSGKHPESHLEQTHAPCDGLSLNVAENDGPLANRRRLAEHSCEDFPRFNRSPPQLFRESGHVVLLALLRRKLNGRYSFANSGPLCERENSHRKPLHLHLP